MVHQSIRLVGFSLLVLPIHWYLLIFLEIGTELYNCPWWAGLKPRLVVMLFWYWNCMRILTWWYNFMSWV
jgi:hypothetical protein